MALRTVSEMEDALDMAVNAGPVLNGRMDAIGHVGALLSGRITAEYLAGIQPDILENAEPGYAKGYREAWNTIYGMACGISIDEAHRM